MRFPADISRDTIVANCHSHNDYWRRVPLYSALEAGCASVEADIWLFDNELYVGHTTSSLAASRTLRSLYVNPILQILDRQNPRTLGTSAAPENWRMRRKKGVFDTSPSQTLVLLVDFKTDGEVTWPYVYEQLSPLRDLGYLTYFNGTQLVNGPITVVGTGNTPFNRIAALNLTHRDVFFDAPVDQLAVAPPGGNIVGDCGTSASSRHHGNVRPTPYNYTNSYYASASFARAVGIPFRSRLSQSQMDRLRAQIQGAHLRGLKVRYWAIPDWPRSLRNSLWSILVHEGVDILNVDDLESTTRREWIPALASWKWPWLMY